VICVRGRLGGPICRRWGTVLTELVHTPVVPVGLVCSPAVLAGTGPQASTFGSVSGPFLTALMGAGSTVVSGP